MHPNKNTGSEQQRKDSSRADGLPENPTALGTALIDADGQPNLRFWLLYKK